MKNRYENRIISIILWLLVFIFIPGGCKVQNLFEDSSSSVVNNLEELKWNNLHQIQPDDKITISIWNHNELSIGSVFNIYNTNESFGKWLLVDKNGMVNLPKLGKFSIGGMTCEEAADQLELAYTPFLVDPIIVVKVLNRTVSLLGEVRSPGNYILEKEITNLSEMIGFGQGFTDDAEIAKVQLFRTGKCFVLDLSKLDDLSLYNLSIRSGDIIIIPSKKGKRFQSKSSTIIPFASFLTAIAIAFSAFK